MLARGDGVAALVRDPDKARRVFGEPDGLRIRPIRLDDPRDLSKAFDGIRTVFIAMGSIGVEGVLQRIAISTAAGVSSIKQVTRLAVLNTSADSRGINQRAHYSIDQFASSTGVPYSTIRPAIFSASLLAAARQVRASRTWTGLAGSGRMALIDHRDVAEAGSRVLTEPALWGAHHDLTGPVPMSWPEALSCSAELGEPVTFRVAAERQFLDGLLDAGVPAGDGTAAHHTRVVDPLAGENDYTTDTFQQITSAPAPDGRVPSRLPRGIRLIPAHHPLIPAGSMRGSAPTRRPVRRELTFIAGLIGFSVARLAIGELSQSLGTLVAAGAAELAARSAADDGSTWGFVRALTGVRCVALLRGAVVRCCDERARLAGQYQDGP